MKFRKLKFKTRVPKNANQNTSQKSSLKEYRLKMQQKVLNDSSITGRIL